MMSAQEREEFRQAAAALADQARARGADPRTVLSPLFHQALLKHAGDDDRLLELWDQLTARPLL